MKQALNLFFKYPEKGKVKTRLSSRLNSDFVVSLYRELIRDIIKTGRMADADLILSISSTSEKTVHDYESEFGARTFLQRGDDLGERMYHSLEDVFLSGYEQCVLIGSDIPDISPPLINKAFDKLSASDIVLGPGSDGGYYLLGLNREKLHRGIFEKIRWSSGNVLDKTLENISKLKLSYRLLDELNDIDDLEDLKEFYRKNRDLDSYTIRFLKKRPEEFYEQL
jgi:rSAM/selenodomain-associated transferase 1